MSSVGSAPTKSTTGRMSAFPEKKPTAGRTGVPQGRPSSKPEATSGTKENTASRQSSVSGSAVKKPVNKAMSNVPLTTAAPAATGTVSNDTPSLAAETAAAEAAAAAATSAENNHELVPEISQPDENYPSSPDVELMDMHHVNGHERELNGTGAHADADADDAENDPTGTTHRVTKNSSLVTNVLSDELMQLDMNAERISHELDPFDMSHPVRDAHTDELTDPIIAWGEPQGLPVPPPAASRRQTSLSVPANAKTVPIQQAGYTDASSHAVGPGSTKLPPYDKIKPVYVDVAFLPGGGNPHLVDAEWFKRVRARYYVATDPLPGAALMEALTVGKESWTGDDAQLSASLIIAYDTEELMIWLGRNAGRLAACHLELTAVASRSSIQLLDEQQTASAKALTCAGYRIDF
ncbi:putative microtubule-associated protein [Fasciola hepatica]|uniref:Microtubule-associated protein n=1 Tax=Fasciola hepatica TaxID=6192 RepID=A0A4E0RIX9_FASHE|nr:putative microtubule-associated protein [Fasciola hepatica]